MKYRCQWRVLGLVVFVSFLVLGYVGYDIYQEAPPIPNKVQTSSGKVIFTKANINDGQSVWQSTGGQELGTVWGHGAYLAPDWSADWLHKEAVYLLNLWSMKEFNKGYDSLVLEKQEYLKGKLKENCELTVTIKKQEY